MGSSLMTAKQCERYLGKLEVLGGEDCWNWKGYLDPKGYGRIWVTNRMVSAHRLAWDWQFGPILNGLIVCHHCDNRRCCNPHHLFLGTDQDNADDCRAKGRAKNLRGAEHGMAVLTEPDVIAIRALIAQGVSKSAIGRHYGVDRSTIYLIGEGKKWGWLLEKESECEVVLPNINNTPTLKGERNPHALLTDAMVQAIRLLSRKGWTGKRIAAMYGISRSHVSSILLRHSWTHLPDEPSVPTSVTIETGGTP